MKLHSVFVDHYTGTDPEPGSLLLAQEPVQTEVSDSQAVVSPYVLPCIEAIAAVIVDFCSLCLSSVSLIPVSSLEQIKRALPRELGSGTLWAEFSQL